MQDFRYFECLTDDTGMLQFSKLSQPDPESGYTLDDNARALIVSLNMSNGYQYVRLFTDYLYKSQQKDGSWSNLYYNGKFFSRFNSEDSIGRALLACSFGINGPYADIKETCSTMLENNLHHSLHFKSPRAIGYSLLALCKLNEDEFDDEKRSLLNKLKEFLFSCYSNSHVNNWYWFENYLTYCNGILPQSMFATYAVTGDRKALKIGYDSLNFLNSILFRKGFLNIIGNQGWYHREDTIPLFDQQPVDAASTACACLEAYKILGEQEYLHLAGLAHEWYRGNNIHQLSLYNQDTGGCYDALTTEGVNLNQGAEAVLSLLLTNIFFLQNNTDDQTDTFVV